MFVGMLSKITRKGCISSVISPKSSPFLQSNSGPLRLPSFSPHSTLLRSHLCRPNGVSGTIQNGGFPSSILAKRFFSNALLKRIPEPIRNGRLMHSITSLNRGRRSFFGRFTTDGIVIPLIMMNVTVFMLWSLDQFMLQKILVYVENLPRGQLHTLITSVFSQIEPFMRQNFMVSVDNLTSGRLHTLITSAISHTEPFHLISNMIELYYFGTFIEQSFGSRYLLKLYLGGAIAGSVFYLAYHAFMAGSFQSNPMGDLISLSKNPGPGASGAVNAIILLNAITWLDIFLYPVRTAFFYANIPTPAFLLGFIIIGHDVWRVRQGDLQVSGSALLGGATAAALGWLRVRKSRARRF